MINLQSSPESMEMDCSDDRSMELPKGNFTFKMAKNGKK